MVSTRRRSSGCTGGRNSAEDMDDVEETLSQLPEVSCRRARRTSAATTTHAVLEPVVEQPAVAAGGAAAAPQEDEDTIAAQKLPQRNEQQAERQQQPEQQSQQQHRVRREPAPTQHQQPQHNLISAQQSQQQLHHEAIAPVQAASDGDSSSDDWDFDSPNMLQNLAASICAALGTTAGNKQHQQQKHAAAVVDNKTEDAKLRWRPTTGLQLPPRMGQLVHRAAAALPPQQQRELAVAGPQVANPATDTTADVATQAAGAAIMKPKGFAKYTRVPTLDPAAAAKAARKAKPDTAGKKWYDLPAVKVTDEVKKDLRLLRLRGAYDPKRFYRSFDDTKFPKHFAIGTVVDDPLDYHGGRLSKGQRKASLTEQLLADTELTHSRKKRYSKLQEDANKWVKHKKRKTDMPRKTPSKHRPKH